MIRHGHLGKTKFHALYRHLGNAVRAGLGAASQVTVFDLAFNPEVETLDFIDQQFPSDVLKYYKPTMEQETQLEEGDELFDYMFALMNALPTGSSAVRPVLLVFPKAAEGAAGAFVAWKVDCTVSFANYDAVEKKLSFSLAFAGDVAHGSAAFTAGAPTFTAD